MRDLHILHGGITNGDKAWLMRAARRRLRSPSWIAPKSAKTGDETVIFVGGAFFATARIASEASKRPDWGPRRYGAAIDSVRLIDPPISLDVIKKRMPGLKWAIYPRSIATPSARMAGQIRTLVASRRKKKGSDIEDDVLHCASLEELRARARKEARAFAKKKIKMAVYRVRSRAVHVYVLRRAEGICEGCSRRAPFLNRKSLPYLEPHHTTRLADDGPDDPTDVIALCPTCHSRVHHSGDGDAYNLRLKKKLQRLESRG